MTGVQTCALPISTHRLLGQVAAERVADEGGGVQAEVVDEPPDVPEQQLGGDRYAIRATVTAEVPHDHPEAGRGQGVGLRVEGMVVHAGAVGQNDSAPGPATVGETQARTHGREGVVEGDHRHSGLSAAVQ